MYVNGQTDNILTCRSLRVVDFASSNILVAIARASSLVKA